MSLSHYLNFPVFDLFGIFRTPLCRNPCGRSKSAQKSLKTFKLDFGHLMREGFSSASRERSSVDSFLTGPRHYRIYKKRT